jgi:gliding motility-associated-like protein
MSLLPLNSCCRLLFIAGLLFTVFTESNAQCGCTHIIYPNSPYTIDGATFKALDGSTGIKPGAKVCFANGTRADILIKNVKGTADQPITFTNMCDGKVIIKGTPGTGRLLYFGGVEHVRITGTGNPNEQYGIEFTTCVQALDFRDLSTNCEADHIYFHDIGYSAMNAKTDPTCDPKTWRGNFTMYDIHFHDNWIKNTGGEAMYIGESHYHSTFPVTCNGVVTQQLEHTVLGVRIYNNIFDNIGRDAIQVGSTIQDCYIHHNTINGFGATNEYGQQSGIQVNPGTNAECYNNYVDTGTGFALFAGGRGGSHFYNNVFANALQGAIICADYAPLDPTGFVFTNNTLVNCSVYGIYMLSEQTNRNLFINNIIVGTSEPGYQYVKLNNPAKIKWTFTNNYTTKNINDVKFVNPSAKDYRLQPGSPAIDAGMDLKVAYGLAHDFDLDENPRKGTWDIGAYEAQPNKPTANAGPDKAITLPTNTVILNGAGTGPAAITKYTWALSSGEALDDPIDFTKADLTLTGLKKGEYIFSLIVEDVNGAVSAPDLVTVTVFDVGTNQAPVANAGVDKTLTLPANSITFSGIGTDLDGTIVSYSWELDPPGIPNPPLLTNANTAVLTVQVPTVTVATTYTLKLTVTDDDGATHSDNVTLTVNVAPNNAAPTVNAGADKSIKLPTSSTTLTGTATDSDGTIQTIKWECKTCPKQPTLANADKLTMTASGMDAVGQYTFRLTVTDNGGATKFDEVVVTVSNANQAPVANAGTDKTVTLPTTTINLTGSGSDPDVGGSITAYQWTRVAGPNNVPALTLTNANTATVSIGGLVAGTYTFRLTVTDNNSATGFDEVTVTVANGPVNQAPTANAGSDKTITMPTNSVILNGSGTDPEGTTLTYAWTQKSGPNAGMSGQATASLSLTGLAPGPYVFTLRVTDTGGAFDDDDVTVTVLPSGINLLPVVNAGGNKYLTLPTTSTNLVGVASDPDGSISQYEWTQEEGPNTAALTGATTSTLGVSGLQEGQYLFRLTATDNSGAAASDFATINVNTSNLPPIVDAGPDRVITAPQSTIWLNGSASDPDGTIANYLWSKEAGGTANIISGNTLTGEIADLEPGDYVFSLTVTDDDGVQSQARVNVTVLASSANQPPVANAGSDQVLFLPTNSTTVEGSGFDPDGTIDTYAWTQVGGTLVTRINFDTPTLTITDILNAGSYTFRLTVTDNLGVTAFDEVNITVNAASQNQLPIVDAGPNLIVNLPTNAATLTGSAIDNDGSISQYAWTKIAGPAVNLQNAATSTLSLSNLVEGSYTFRLTATDNGGATAFAETRVIVFPSTVNQIPLANAGTNQTITLPTNSTSLVGAGFDPDGSIISYAWTRIAGPTTFALVSPGSQVTALNNLVKGTYTFRLTVTDNSGAKGFDDVIITVNDATDNNPPVANAGGNQTIKLPTTSTVLFGSGSDIDGSVVTYDWLKVSGGTANLTNNNTPTLTVKNMQAGIYTFRLRVTDNDGATNDDVVTIVVNDLTANNPPIANAGPDKTVTLPVNATTISGSGSDNDGSITAYLWEKTVGPNVPLNNTATENASLTNLTEGLYVLRITVTDNAGATDFDEMNLRVLPSNTNQPPLVTVANDTTLVLPTNSMTLRATTSDLDGTISTYFWTKVSGPTATLADPGEEDTQVQDLVEGIYIFQLSVIDDKSTSASDQIKVTVLPVGSNVPPIVDAGADQTITLPVSTISLVGTATDPEGSAMTYLWTKVTGGNATPNPAGSETTLTPTFDGLTVGTYSFKLSVTDANGSVGSDIVQVTVNPVPPNQPPIVDAGVNRALLAVVPEVQLNGNATDPDGTVTSVLWTQVRGPQVPLENAATPNLTVRNLDIGTYIFRLTATDNEGAKGFREAIIFVTGDTTTLDIVPPIVYAGEDTTVVFPANDIVIVGNALDPDGTFIRSFEWTQISGPQVPFTVDDATLTVTGLEMGAYTFRLTAVDGDLQSADDDVVIYVIDEADEIPKFFSPNNDGIGDTWVFRNPENYDKCAIKVFARTGKEVYSAAPYGNNWWTGVTSSGKPVDDGDYYYILKCEDGRQVKGALRIIR